MACGGGSGSPPANAEPSVTLISPAGTVEVALGNPVNIRYRDEDPDDTASTDLFADRDGDLSTLGDQVLIEAGRAERDGAVQTVTWDTAGVPSGSYRILARTTDGTTTVTDQAPGQVLVNEPPTLVLTEPTTNVAVPTGETVEIQYRDDDPDDAATTLLYADEDGDLDTTGDQYVVAQRPHQNGAMQSISWGTVGVRNGDYAIVGVISDGINAAVRSTAPAIVSVRMCSPVPGTTGTGPALDQPVSMALDSLNNRLLLVDLTPDAVISVDLATADRTTVSSATVGTGPALGYPSGIDLDATNGRVLVADPGFGGGLSALVAVDLGTGDRTILSGSGVGTGPQFGDPWDVALDSTNNRAIVADRLEVAVLLVDLATGDRTVLSDATTGSGPSFSDPYSVALDASRNRVIVADFGLDALLAVDLASGARSVLSDAATGSGPSFTDPVQVRIDVDGDRVLVVGLTAQALLSVDLATGDRSFVSVSSVGSGPDFDRPHSVALNVLCGRAFVGDTDTDAVYSVDLATGDRLILSQ
jgi:hypothetical protein